MGDTIWTRTYGGSSEDLGFTVQQTQDGGYIVAGVAHSVSNSWDIWIVKTDMMGDTVWTRLYGGSNTDYGPCVQQTTDSGYVVVGYTASFGAGGYDIWILKTNALGDTAWTKTYGGIGDDIGYCIQQTTGGGYIIAGMTTSFGGGQGDLWLIKTDSAGDTVWTKTYGLDICFECAYSLQQTTDGGYVITGYNNWYSSVGSGDVWLLKTNALGDTVWTKTYGGALADCGRAVKQTSDGGYIISGYTEPSSMSYADVLLIRTNEMGDTIWTSTYGGDEDDKGFSIQQLQDEEYIVTGFTSSFGSGESDVWLLKIAPEPGIEENEVESIESHNFDATAYSGSLLLPEGKKCRVFNITGRMVAPDNIRPGIYFIEIEGKITRKVVKIR